MHLSCTRRIPVLVTRPIMMSQGSFVAAVSEVPGRLTEIWLAACNWSSDWTRLQIWAGQTRCADGVRACPYGSAGGSPAGTDI
jgi:hypothetical protein